MQNNFRQNDDIRKTVKIKANSKKKTVNIKPIIAIIVLIEIIVTIIIINNNKKLKISNRNISQYNYFVISEDGKFGVIDKVKDYVVSKGYKYLDIDGVKVLFDDGWALVRASNTGPNITARFEAATEERLNELQNEFVNLINELNKE